MLVDIIFIGALARVISAAPETGVKQQSILRSNTVLSVVDCPSVAAISKALSQSSDVGTYNSTHCCDYVGISVADWLKTWNNSPVIKIRKGRFAIKLDASLPLLGSVPPTLMVAIMPFRKVFQM